MQETWNKKFGRDGLLYGTEVNNFIKSSVPLIEKNSKILCLGEGEGRNAIYLAKQGFQVEALDASDVGLKKLHNRAFEEQLAITVRHTLIENWDPHIEYGAIISTFTHLPKAIQKDMFTKSILTLKEGGFFIAEFFSIEQVNFQSGGPKDTELLYALDDLYHHFKNLPCTIYKLSQEIITLNEGYAHNGEASVIRIILKRD